MVGGDPRHLNVAITSKAELDRSLAPRPTEAFAQFELCRLLAQSVSLARSVWRDGNRRIADARVCMSVYRRISDPVQSNAECTLMTQSGPSYARSMGATTLPIR